MRWPHRQAPAADRHKGLHTTLIPLMTAVLWLIPMLIVHFFAQKLTIRGAL